MTEMFFLKDRSIICINMLMVLLVVLFRVQGSLEFEDNDLIKSITSDKNIKPISFKGKIKTDCESIYVYI